MTAFLRRLYLAVMARERQPDLLSPGILAEVLIVMGENGWVQIQTSKLAPDHDPDRVFGYMLERWLGRMSELGVTLDFVSEDGKHHPLVRPAEPHRIQAAHAERAR